MSNFTTRVELHQAKWPDDYEKLHKEMEAEGFSRKISKDGKTFYHLPFAEYSKIGNYKISEVLSSAERAAKKVGKKFSILTTQSEIAREWLNLEVVK